MDALSTREDGQIVVSASATTDKSQVHLVVADNGEGIPDDIVEKVFDPFFTTKEAGKGTGLGLATCRRVISEHGGEIWAESVLGSDTAIHILLPADVA